MKHFWRTLSFLRQYKKYAWLNVFFNLLTTFFTIASLVVLKPFLDILFSNMPPEPLPLEGGGIAVWLQQINNALIIFIQNNGKKSGLLVVCGVVLGCFFLKNLFRYLALFVMAPVRNGIERDLRQQVFNHFLILPITYFSDERKGDLMARMSADVHEIQWSVLRSLETIVRSPVAIIGSLGVMIYISPTLTLFSFVLILFVGLIIGKISRALRKTSADAQASVGNLLSLVEETLGGIRIVQAFHAEDYKKQQFSNENQHYFRLMNRIMRRKDLSSPLTEFLGIGIVATLLLFGGNLVFNGHFEASTFVTFVLMFYNIIDPAKSFASAFYDIQKGSAAAERVYQILEAKQTIKNIENPIKLNQFQQEITFDNVCFSYTDDALVLQHIQFSIQRGETVALVGASGAGKSTIGHLLLRFYDPVSGQILLDGQPLNKYDLGALRSAIGWVDQEAVLFNDTVYNNIVFGAKGIDSKAVEAAAKIANAHDFIQKLTNGYQTVIGDRGTKLSGGQRQRLTIARAILRNPPILVLDEATSALDAKSEQEVQLALEKATKGRTVVVIAHRLATVQRADKIVVLEEGQIDAIGSHEQLLQKNALYRKFVELQRLD